MTLNPWRKSQYIPFFARKQTHWVLEAKIDLSSQLIQDPEDRHVAGRGGWGGKDWEFGISRCKLVHIGWINKAILPYSKGTVFSILG